jgi:MFS family permease
LLADRYDRRSLLVAAQLVTMVNLCLLAFLTLAGLIEIWQVYLSSVGLGLTQAVTMPARQALIRSLVGDADMLNAVALNAMQMHSSRILWPSLAGVLISLLGVGATLGLSAASSLTGVICLTRIRGIDDTVSMDATHDSHLQQIAHGVRHAFTSPGVSTIMLLSLACGLFGLAYMNLAPAFARDELGLGSSGAGLFIMSMGVGAIVGSGLLLFFPVKDGRQLFVLLVGVFGVNLMAQGAVPWLSAAFLLMAAFGFSNSALVVAGQTYLQTTVPPQMLGRVIGLWSLAGGLGFVAALPIGLIGDAVGLRWSIAGAGALLLASTFVVIAKERRSGNLTPGAAPVRTSAQ